MQDAQRQVVVMIERVGQEGVLRTGVDEAVDPAVGGEERFVVLASDMGFELGDQVPCCLTVRWTRSFGGQAGCPGLQAGADFVTGGAISKSAMTEGGP